MVIEVGAKVGGGTPFLGTRARVLVVRLGPMGTLTQVLDVGLSGRGARRCAECLGDAHGPGRAGIYVHMLVA
jgi:hypothetical protein